MGRKPKYEIGTSVMFGNTPYGRKNEIVGSVGEITGFESGEYEVWDGVQEHVVKSGDLVEL